jgi:DNA polymerase-1
MKPVAFDVETTGLQWTADELFLAQFGEPGEAAAYDHPHDRLGIQARLLDDAAFYAHNTKFDMHFAQSAGYTLPSLDRWHDTKVMASLIDERTSTALKARTTALGATEATNEKAVKDWLAAEARRRKQLSKETGDEFKPPTYGNVPDEIMHPYALEDIELTHHLRENYEPIIRNDPELNDLYEMERGVMVGLYKAERRGIPVDREAAALLEAELLNAHERIEETCVELAGIPHFNPRSPKQVGEALKRRSAPLSHATLVDGLPKTDEENLLAIDDDLARAILDYRGAQKMYAMVRAILHGKDDGTAPFLHTDDRLHPFFWQNGARTGRMSCSDPNIQQWHRDDLRLRYLVEASPGHKLVTCDLDAIEMRIFAAFCGPGPLLDMMRGDGDPHVAAARASSLGTRRRSTGEVESERQRGKVFNYSVMYGAGVRSMRKQFGFDTQRARKALDDYHRAFPEVLGLQQRIEYALYDKGYVKTPWGRRQRVDKFVDREAYKFTNYLIQGTAADLLKQSLVKADAAGLPVIAAVHDELIVEVPEADAEEAARELQRAMTDDDGRLSSIIPIEAEPQIVDRWSDAKTPGYVPDYAR